MVTGRGVHTPACLCCGRRRAAALRLRPRGYQLRGVCAVTTTAGHRVESGEEEDRHYAYRARSLNQCDVFLC